MEETYQSYLQKLNTDELATFLALFSFSVLVAEGLDPGGYELEDEIEAFRDILRGEVPETLKESIALYKDYSPFVS